MIFHIENLLAVIKISVYDNEKILSRKDFYVAMITAASNIKIEAAKNVKISMVERMLKVIDFQWGYIDRKKIIFILVYGYLVNQI